VLLERGALEETDGILDRLGVSDVAATYADTLLLGMRSGLRLAQGRAEEALADARASAVGAFADGNPTACPWRSEAALALVALGRGGEALKLAEDELALARAFGAPHGISAALRATARCQVNLERMAVLLEEAIATVEHTSARLELTRATIELGAVLRRAGKRRAAIETLRIGLDLAHHAGATAIAERAQGELKVAGARPRRLMFSGIDALTASERRMAEAAASGLTNREIAQSLFLSIRTVENTLRRAYQKLDIGSRDQLGPLFGSHGSAAPAVT
jgi:DNA-binding CsgD family transcriptional regulator